jgi:hypothetical protein
MTTIQLKAEIKKAIDKVPENVLPDILDYLNRIQHQSHDQLKFDKNVKKILTEDRELFERLAK